MDLSKKYIDMVDKRKRTVTLIAKITFVAVSLVLLALTVVLAVDMSRTLNPKVVLEAGESLPSAESVCGRKNARYEYDEEKIDLSVPGEYKIYIVYGSNKRITVRLSVVDTIPPKGAVKTLCIHQGSAMLPAANDFFDSITDATEVKAELSGALPSELGEHSVRLQLTDAAGNTSKYTTKLSVIIDTELPVFVSVPDRIYGYVGQGISFKEGVVYTDNCFGVRLEVDDTSVDAKTKGTYGIIYHLIDAAGNRVTATSEVVIQDMPMDTDTLNAKIAEIAEAEGMSKNMPKEDLCRLIYGYVNDPKHGKEAARFKYVGDSNDPSRTDWRREAWLGLQNGEGDCYTYFAISKAFFEYFGIENKDIERTKGAVEGETHFWSMVNIGTSASPRWYFFDATRYAGSFTVGGNNGCLLTKAQLESYKSGSGIEGYGATYYKYDRSAYPTPSTNVINTNYSW